MKKVFIGFIFILFSLAFSFNVNADSVIGGSINTNDSVSSIESILDNKATVTSASNTLTISLNNNIFLTEALKITLGGSVNKVIINLNGYNLNAEDSTSSNGAESDGENALELSGNFDLTINGTGKITGGDGHAMNPEVLDVNDVHGKGGNAIFLCEGTLGTIKIDNDAQIIGGAGADIVFNTTSSGDSETLINYSGEGGNGIGNKFYYPAAGHNVTFGLNVINGLIQGGKGGNFVDNSNLESNFEHASSSLYSSGAGGNAIEHNNGGSNTINIGSNGVLKGGNSGDTTITLKQYMSSAETNQSAGSAMDIAANTNMNISGKVYGGNGGSGTGINVGGSFGADAIYIVRDNTPNILVNSSGLIQGGKGGDSQWNFAGGGGNGLAFGIYSLSTGELEINGTAKGGDTGNVKASVSAADITAGSGVLITYESENKLKGTGTLIGGNGGTANDEDELYSSNTSLGGYCYKISFTDKAESSAFAGTCTDGENGTLIQRSKVSGSANVTTTGITATTPIEGGKLKCNATISGEDEDNIFYKWYYIDGSNYVGENNFTINNLNTTTDTYKLTSSDVAPTYTGNGRRYICKAYSLNYSSYTSGETNLDGTDTSGNVRPSTPTNIQTQTTGNNNIKISWNESKSNAPDHRYIIERTTINNPNDILENNNNLESCYSSNAESCKITLEYGEPTGKKNELVKNGEVYSFIDTSADINRTYYYRVKVTSYTSEYIGYQNVIPTEWKKITNTFTLLPPTGLTAVKYSYNSVKLNWTKANSATEYKIYRSTSEDGTYSLIDTTSNLTYTDTNLTTNTTYYYKLKSVLSGTESDDYSLIVNATPKLDAPSINSGEDDTLGLTEGSIKISWKEVPNVTKYKITYGYSDNSSTPQESISFDSTPIITEDLNTILNGLETDKYYYIKIESCIGANELTCSQTPSIYGPIQTSTTNNPDTPNNFKITNANTNTINLSWDKISRATGYVIYNDKDEIIKEITDKNTTTFTHTSLATGTTYYYYIKTKINDGQNIYYSDKTTTINTTTYLNNINGFNKRLYGYNSILLTWNSVTNATGYNIYRSTGGAYSYIGSTTNTYLYNSNLSSGKIYYYRIIPYTNNSAGTFYSLNYSYSGGIYTLKQISRPKITKSSKKYIKIKWSNIPGESGYQIARSTKKNKGYKVIKTLNYKYSSYKKKTKRNKTYYYKVRAFTYSNGKTIYAPWSTYRKYKLK